ncbi:MAG: preprotein translocase subunit SecE [Synechococcaceae bacterium WB8_1B_136]|nr:preprotein translocase subunit SecE [Synechococcaceae bacterium WB8_1B_136]
MDTPTNAPQPDVPPADNPRPDAESVTPAEAGASAEPGQTGFLAGTLDELRKVVWPSRQQLFSESVAVILMVSLSAFAIAAIDRFYGWANSQVFR